MEPINLNQSPPDDIPLEQWLRSQATIEPLADNGFSLRVLRQLPPPEHSSPTRKLVLLGGGLVGGYLAWQQGFSVGELSATGVSLASVSIPALDQLLQPPVLLALALTGLSLVFVYWRELLRQLSL